MDLNRQLQRIILDLEDLRDSCPNGDNRDALTKVINSLKELYLYSS